MLVLIVRVGLGAVGGYLALGSLAAVGLHLRGLRVIDPGVIGGGLFFRLLITPGIIALWPLLLSRWRRAVSAGPCPGAVDRPVRPAGLRRLHRLGAQSLAVVVPLIAGVGVGLRPPLLGQEGDAQSLLGENAPLPDVRLTVSEPFEGLPVRLRMRSGATGGTQLELALERDLEIPVLLLYWSPSPPGPGRPGEHLLGPVWGPGVRRYPLPPSATDGGVLSLWAATTGERVASAALPAPDAEGG